MAQKAIKISFVNGCIEDITTKDLLKDHEGEKVKFAYFVLGPSVGMVVFFPFHGPTENEIISRVNTSLECGSMLAGFGVVRLDLMYKEDGLPNNGKFATWDEEKHDYGRIIPREIEKFCLLRAS